MKIFQLNAPWVQRLVTRAFDLQGKAPSDLEEHLKGTVKVVDLTDPQYKYGALTSCWGVSDEAGGGVARPTVIRFSARLGASESKKIIRVTNAVFWSMSPGDSFSMAYLINSTGAVVPLMAPIQAVSAGKRDGRLASSLSVMQVTSGTLVTAISPGDPGLMRAPAPCQGGFSAGAPAPRFDPQLTLRASDVLEFTASRSGFAVGFNLEWEERDASDSEMQGEA